jgi:hypothetical protein
MIIGDKTKIYGVYGTTYHSREDKTIVDILKGDFKGFSLNLKLNGEIINISHGKKAALNNASLVSNILRTEMDSVVRNSNKRKTSVPTIIGRHHAHLSSILKNDIGIWGYINPCWQYSSEFVLQRSCCVTPNIGATIIEIEENEPAKIFQKEYEIDSDIHDILGGNIEWEEEKEKQRKEKSFDDFKELMKERKV